MTNSTSPTTVSSFSSSGATSASSGITLDNSSLTKIINLLLLHKVATVAYKIIVDCACHRKCIACHGSVDEAIELPYKGITFVAHEGCRRGSIAIIKNLDINGVISLIKKISSGMPTN